MDAHTTKLVFHGWTTNRVDDGIAFSVCFVVCFAQGFNDILKVFFPFDFAFVFGELGDVVRECEEGGGGFVVECGVPVVWCDAVPVVNGSVCDSFTDIFCVFFVLDGGVIVGASNPGGVVEDDCGVGGFLVNESVVVKDLAVESKAVVVGIVFECDTNLFTEVLPSGDNAGAVTEDVVGVVRPFAAYVAGVGVVGGASWWDVEGFVTSHVCGECVEDEGAVSGDEVSGDGVDDVFAVLHEVVSRGLARLIVGGCVGWGWGCGWG